MRTRDTILHSFWHAAGQTISAASGICILLTISARAQDPLDMLYLVKQDSVFLFLTDVPRIGHKVIVERKGPSDKEYVRLTQKPLEAVLDAPYALSVIGDDSRDIMASLKVKTPEQMLLTLRTDRLAGTAYMMTYNAVGTVLARFYKAGGNEKGKKYSYRVSIVDRAEKTVQTIKKDIVIEEKPPEPPRKVTYTQDKRAILAQWEYPKWVAGSRDMTVQFRLYRRGPKTKEFERVNRRILLRIHGVKLTYADEEVQEGATYTFRMTAVDAAGVESAPSQETAVTVKDLTPPSIPRQLVTIPQQNRIELIWNMNPDIDMDAYHVYRWEGVDEKAMKRIGSVPSKAPGPRFMDSTIRTGLQYYYAVSAVDKAGNESERSNRISAFPTDTIAPGKPQNVKASVEKHSVRISWTPPSDRDILGYKVSRGFTANEQFFLADDLIRTLSITDDGGKKKLEPGQRYCYAVIAVDSVWRNSDTAQVWVSLPDDEAPSRPGAVLAENEQGRGVRIRWNASPSLDVAKYAVRRKTGDKTEDIAVVNASKLEHFDTVVIKGQEAAYAVVAIDSSGNKSKPTHSEKTGVRDFKGPPQPQFTAAALVAKGVKIRWERVVDFDLAGYNVYRSDLPTGSFEKINTQPVTALEYTDTQGKKKHWYCIKAVDTSGNESLPGTAVAPVEQINK